VYRPLGEFESLSYHQTLHATTYITGLAAARSKTCKGLRERSFQFAVEIV
jgi:hypothetical protein